MDLVATLRAKIDTLPPGDFLVGLRSVLVHIETSYKHLTRGQAQDDEQAFTDAIYRTNQAFEGSIKEAYRVLAVKNPEKKSPFEIETYLSENNVFKPRVLSQFTTYRTQWRNPSTHDYTLSFDESEAFLAITSVSAFACVLIDQIAERVAFVQSSKEAKSHKADQRLPDDDEPAPLDMILVAYLALFNKVAVNLPIHTDSQLYGAAQGLISSMAPVFKMERELALAPDRPEKADLLVTFKDEKVLVTMKRSNTRGAVREGLFQLEHAMGLARIKHSILFLFHPTGKLNIYERSFEDGVVHLLVPIAQDDPDESSGELAAKKDDPTPA